MYRHTPSIVLALNVWYFYLDHEIDPLFGSRVRKIGEKAAGVSLWTPTKADLFLNILYTQG